MGPGETLAMLALCAFGVALLALIFAIYSKRMSFKQRQLELQAETHAGSGLDAGRLIKLEQRVRVLERIATDRGQDVAHQIEILRDRRQAEDLDRGLVLDAGKETA